MISIDRNPSQRRLRQFGALLVVYATLIAYWQWCSGTSDVVAASIVGTASIVAIIDWFFPTVLRVPYVISLVGAVPIAWAVSHLVLVTIFYLVLTPIGLIMRLFGHDPLNARFDPDAKSYWQR
jgi:ABC-type uncharacterized transport system permease subunit